MCKNDRILFIIPRTDRPTEEIRGLCPPLGVLYLCTFLNQRGFVCEFIDMYAKPIYMEEIKRKIESFKPDIVGLSMMFSEAKKVGYIIAKMIKRVKKDVVIFAGGVDVTFRGKEMLKECSDIDYAIRYDGEITILELMEYISGKQQSIENIRGLIFRRNNHVVVNQAREVFPISQMPTINRNLYNSEDYQYPYTLITSKGCPYSCIFCGGGAYGRGYQLMPLDNLEKEIVALRHKIEADGNLEEHHVIIWDDAFTVNLERSMEVAKLMNKYKLKWGAQGRVNEVTREALRIYLENGCQKLNFGVESADESVLDEIHKNIYLSQVMDVANFSQKYHLPTSFNFIIPLPSDTYESASRTLDFAEQLNELSNVYVSINMNTLFPGTEMYEQHEKYGIIPLYDDEQYNSFTIPGFYTDKLGINEINELAGRAFVLAARSRAKRTIEGIKY